MNEQNIEKLLRKAPLAKVPAGLLKNLQDDIELPRVATHESRVTNHPFRRWLPALGFALWFLGCIVVLGIQASHIAELKRANGTLRANAAMAEVAQTEGASARLLAEELEQLRKDAADVQRLRAEVERLRAQVAQLDVLRAQNHQLREELKARTASVASSPKPEEDFFAVAKERADRIKCIANLKQVCLAALTWVNENKSDRFPTDTAQFKPHLDKDAGGETLLHCPADKIASYEFLSLGRTVHESGAVFVRCPIHNNVGTADGAAHQLSNAAKVVQKDGKWIIQPVGQ